MPRFAVLAHDWPAPHLDLLLERDGVLRGWRLPPSFDPNTPTPAEPTADHRPLYLDYEGPVSGDRGSVTRCDGGELEWVEGAAERVAFRLSGLKWNGLFELVRTGDGWVFRPAAVTSAPRR